MKIMTKEEIQELDKLINQLKDIQSKIASYDCMLKELSLTFIKYVNSICAKHGVFGYRLEGDDTIFGFDLSDDHLIIMIGPEGDQRITLPKSLLSNPNWESELTNLILPVVKKRKEESVEYATYLRLKKKFERI